MEKWNEITDRLPYSEPFLFVDSLIDLDENGCIGEYRFLKEAFFYKGHFKHLPITPGVILTECCAQIGLVCLGIYLLKIQGLNNLEMGLSSSEMEFLKPVFPETTVRVESRKTYFRFHKLKCTVQMYDEHNQLVCKGTLAGMIKPQGYGV